MTQPTAEPDYAVMQLGIGLHLQLNVVLLEALGDGDEFSHSFVFLQVVIEPGHQADVFRAMNADSRFAEPQEVQNLVVRPEVGVLDHDFIGTDEVFAKYGFVGEAGGTKMNPVVAFLGGGSVRNRWREQFRQDWKPVG